VLSVRGMMPRRNPILPTMSIRIYTFFRLKKHWEIKYLNSTFLLFHSTLVILISIIFNHSKQMKKVFWTFSLLFFVDIGNIFGERYLPPSTIWKKLMVMQRNKCHLTRTFVHTEKSNFTRTFRNSKILPDF